MDDVTAPVTTEVVRVLVVDDDALVRAGLALMLGGASDIEVVGQASSGSEGLAMAKQLAPDVVLMDIRMPGMTGLEATEHIGSWRNPPKVIVLTTFDADDYVTRALGAGASGFLLKDTPPASIVDAIRKVADGDPMLSPSVTAQLIAHLTAGAAPERGREAREAVTRLTEREQEVAVAVGGGLSNAEIAEQLHLSVPTVKAHIGRLFMKLGVTNRVQIAILVHNAGLV